MPGLAKYAQLLHVKTAAELHSSTGFQEIKTAFTPQPVALQRRMALTTRQLANAHEHLYRPSIGIERLMRRRAQVLLEEIIGSTELAETELEATKPRRVVHAMLQTRVDKSPENRRYFPWIVEQILQAKLLEDHVQRGAVDERRGQARQR